MGPETIWIFIPLFALSIPILAILTKHREKRLHIMSEQNESISAQYAKDREQLEERVAVLERIITDQGYSLASEIENLRDTTPLNIEKQIKEPLN